jgi:hypothetical protein
VAAVISVVYVVEVFTDLPLARFSYCVGLLSALAAIPVVFVEANLPRRPAAA